jgi:DNA-binding NtrC family response regulator
MERKLELMVVDDEPIVGKRLKSALEKYGYEVETFETGQSAIQRLKDKPFDIVVSDVRMEDADGLEVLDAVQQSSTRTKTILITGYATVELAREALAKGAYDFLAKPFQPKDLRAMIEKAAKELETEQSQGTGNSK